jgi:hypothetical protein
MNLQDGLERVQRRSTELQIQSQRVQRESVRLCAHSDDLIARLASTKQNIERILRQRTHHQGHQQSPDAS